MNVKVETKGKDKAELGDIVYLEGRGYFLVSYLNESYYLVNLNGATLPFMIDYSLKEINDNLKEYKRTIYGSEDYEMVLHMVK